MQRPKRINGIGEPTTTTTTTGATQQRNNGRGVRPVLFMVAMRSGTLVWVCRNVADRRQIDCSYFN